MNSSHTCIVSCQWLQKLQEKMMNFCFFANAQNQLGKKQESVTDVCFARNSHIFCVLAAQFVCIFFMEKMHKIKKIVHKF